MLPQAYQDTENDDNDFGDPQIVITFSSQQSVLFTSNSTPWFSDGTFKVCPNIFFQVYTVHAKQGRHNFPCVFVLLLNQTETAYTRFSWELFSKVNGSDPEDILLEFEKSKMNAIKNIWPQIERKGCFYHLCFNL